MPGIFFLAIFKGAVADWDMEGQTHITFLLQPNADVEGRPRPENRTDKLDVEHER